MDSRRVTTIALFSTLSFIGRISFSFLPNVQPTTAILLIITIHFGLVDGLLVATISTLIANLFLGLGAWTISQIVSYSIIIILTYYISKFIKNDTGLSIVSFISGLLYGLIISLIQAPIFGWNIFIPYYISGIPYDIFHAIGNLIFFIILNPILKPILLRYKNNNILV